MPLGRLSWSMHKCPLPVLSLVLLLSLTSPRKRNAPSCLAPSCLASPRAYFRGCRRRHWPDSSKEVDTSSGSREAMGASGISELVVGPRSDSHS